MDEVRSLLSRNIKAARSRLNLSQAVLAERAGVSSSFITEIETGRKFPSSGTIAAIASGLSLQPYQLFLDETPDAGVDRQQLVSSLIGDLNVEIDEVLHQISKRYLTKS